MATALCVRIFSHCLRVSLHNGYTRALAQIKQHTHTHKAVVRRLETKSYSLVKGNQTAVYFQALRQTKSFDVCLKFQLPRCTNTAHPTLSTVADATVAKSVKMMMMMASAP